MFRPTRAQTALVLFFFALTLAPAAQAQSAFANYYQIQTVTLDPEHITDYEAAVADLVALFAKHNRKFALNARMSFNDMTIMYVTPLESLADLEAMDAEMTGLQEKDGGAFQKIAARYQGASVSSDLAVFRTRTDLSYLPAGSEQQFTPDAFMQISYWSPRRDQIQTAEDNAKAYAEFFASKKVERPFLILESYIGDGPTYMAVNPGTSRADYYQKAAKMEATLGAELQKVNLKALSAMRNWTAVDTIGRPDISYTP